MLEKKLINLIKNYYLCNSFVWGRKALIYCFNYASLLIEAFFIGIILKINTL